MGLADPFFHLGVKFCNLICCKIAAKIESLNSFGEIILSTSQGCSPLTGSFLSPVSPRVSVSGLPKAVPLPLKIQLTNSFWGHLDLFSCFFPALYQAYNLVTQRSGWWWHVRPRKKECGVGKEPFEFSVSWHVSLTALPIVSLWPSDLVRAFASPALVGGFYSLYHLKWVA